MGIQLKVRLIGSDDEEEEFSNRYDRAVAHVQNAEILLASAMQSNADGSIPDALSLEFARTHAAVALGWAAVEGMSR